MTEPDDKVGNSTKTQMQAARRLAVMGGSEPDITVALRRRQKARAIENAS